MKRILALLLACMLIPSVSRAEAAAAEANGNRGLTYFWFSHGGYLPSKNYEITRHGGGYLLTRDDDASKQVEQPVIDGLLRIIEADDLYAWDGFHESMPDVLDGEDFSLYITFADGTDIDATGGNAFPNRYSDAAAKIEQLLDAALDGEIAGTYRYEGEGFGGDFTITFSDDGTYAFYEGSLSSYMGGGHWFAERKLVYMKEENGLELSFYFLFSDGALTYLEAYSDPFPYVAVPDEGRFLKLGGSGRPVVGTDVLIGDVTEFYYTLSASTDPPFYQRYRFYTENGAYMFYHETREGGGWPQTEEDITVSGAVRLTEDAWRAFFGYLAGGTVKPREESLDDGDSGPWMYLYWTGDQEEYAFPSLDARLAFEAFCQSLAE